MARPAREGGGCHLLIRRLVVGVWSMSCYALSIAEFHIAEFHKEEPKRNALAA